MRFGLIVNGFLVALAWSSAAVIAHPANSTSKQLQKRFEDDDVKCPSDYMELAYFGIRETVRMIWEPQAMATLSRTQPLYNYLSTQPYPPAFDLQSTLLKSTLRTLEAIFGKVYWGPGDSRNAEGLARIQTVLNNFQNMAQTLNGMEDMKFLFYCNDFWLKDVDSEGDSPMVQYMYWDSRSEGRNPDGSWPDGSDGWMDFSQVQGICRESTHTHYAWVNPTIHGSEYTLITLCQDYVAEWFSLWQDAETLTAIVQQNRDISLTAHLNDFSGKALGMVMIHEFSHAPPVFGTPHTLDQPCTLGDGSIGPGYGWYCITQFAQTDTAKALLNADSYSFYATAMYMSKYDWSQGYIRELSKAG